MYYIFKYYFLLLTNASNDGERLSGCRCNGLGNSTGGNSVFCSNSTFLCILIQQHSIVSHFDLNKYCASANTHAIPEDITNDKKTSVSAIYNIRFLIFIMIYPILINVIIACPISNEQLHDAEFVPVNKTVPLATVTFAITENVNEYFVLAELPVQLSLYKLLDKAPNNVVFVNVNANVVDDAVVFGFIVSAKLILTIYMPIAKVAPVVKIVPLKPVPIPTAAAFVITFVYPNCVDDGVCVVVGNVIEPVVINEGDVTDVVPDNKGDETDVVPDTVVDVIPRGKLLFGFI